MILTNECEWCHQWEAQAGQSICPSCWTEQKQWLANMQRVKAEEEMKSRLKEIILSEEEEAILYWKKFFNDLPLVRDMTQHACFNCKRSGLAPYTDYSEYGHKFRKVVCPECDVVVYQGLKV